MRERGMDVLFISSPSNIRYLTGFTGSNGLCIVRGRSALLVTDSRYGTQARRETGGVRLAVAQNGLAEHAASLGVLRRGERAGFESATVTYAAYRGLRSLFPGVTFLPTRELVEDLRVIKEPSEVRRLRAAAKISDAVFIELLEMIRPGVRETDLAAEISYRQRRLGAEGDAFPPIVVAGPRGALPHARPGPRRLRKGDLLTLDFGCVVEGYHSDLTRTVGVGKPDATRLRMYRAVYEAHRNAVASARAGMTGRALDAVARASITAAGFGAYFQHSLGHGLGLHLHERPRISARSFDPLPAGAVVTIEPGVYIQRVGGVRIEDDVLLKSGGCEVLTKAPKELLIV